jgi:hypothetical protein
MAVTNTYADVNNVQPYLTPYGLTIGAGSKPTTTEVEGFLDQAAAEIDAALKTRGYSTPATDATDILFLRMYTSFKATVMSYSAGFGADDFPDGIQQMADDYERFLEDVQDGSIKLPSGSGRKKFGTVKPMRYYSDG